MYTYPLIKKFTFFEILNQYAISSSDKFSSLAVSSAFLSQLQPCLFHGKLTRPTFCGLLKMPNNTKFSCYILLYFTMLLLYSSKDYKNQRMDTQTYQHYRHVFLRNIYIQSITRMKCYSLLDKAPK